MINPAQYQQVLQKMPDPQLMQLLKRPDKIPSQFVIQEINRRKQMRQAEQARKQQVANAVAMQQQPPQQPIGMRNGGEPDENVGSAKEVLAMELRMQKEFSRPVGDEKSPPFYEGMSDVFFNEKGVPKKVSGAMEMTKAIDEGFVFTRDDADKFPAPPISREEKIFKRSNNILEAYGRGGGALLQDADEKAEKYIQELEALNKLSPNYNPLVSSASGMIRTLVPRSETADGLLDRLAGGYDIKVEYDPSKDENLPKPKPKMAEGGITAMGMQVGGSPRYTGSQYDKFRNYSGVSSYGTPRKINLVPSQVGYKSEYDFDMTDADTGPYGFTPLYDIESERRRLNTGLRPYLFSGMSLNPLKTLGRMHPKYKPDGTEIRKADTEEAYKQSQAMQGRTFQDVEDNPQTYSQLGDYGETFEPDLSPDGPNMSTGIKSIESNQTTSENENLVNDAKENVSKLPESNINNQFKDMFSELDAKLEKTKEPFNRDMLINGFKNSELFDTTAASFKDLNDKSKARVEAFNTRSNELRQAREKMIADLEKEGRTKENIVFESLITTGLNLMASPNANFTQALGEAGKAGLATFQSLRKEEKDRVRQKHLMAYQLAEQEFAHKNQADQLEASLDLQKVNFDVKLQEISRQEKKDYIEESKLAKELEQKDEQLNIMKDKNALEITKTKINSLIAMDRLAVEKAGMNSLIQHRQDSTDLENKKLDQDTGVLGTMIKYKGEDETAEDVINKYLASQSNSTNLATAQQDLIKEIGKELAKKVDLDRAVDDPQYAASIIVQLQDLTMGIRDLSFGSGDLNTIRKKVTG